MVIRAVWVVLLVWSAGRSTARQQTRQENFDALERYIDARTAHPDEDPQTLRHEILGDQPRAPRWLR